MGPHLPQLAQLCVLPSPWLRTYICPVLGLTQPAWDLEIEPPALSSPPCGCNHPPGPRIPSCSHSQTMSLPFPNQSPRPFSPRCPPLTPFPLASSYPEESQGPGDLPSPPLTEVEVKGATGEVGPPPLGKKSLQLVTGAGWRLGLRTTGSPSQILFPVQLQSYRVPGLDGSGSGVPRRAAPALGREVTSRSALPAHGHFTRLIHTCDNSQAEAPKWENIFCGRILIFDISKRAL